MSWPPAPRVLSFDALTNQPPKPEYPKPVPLTAGHQASWDEFERTNRALPPEEQVD